jgi:hypothetical protein
MISITFSAYPQDDGTTILWYKFDEEVNNDIEDLSPHLNDDIVTGQIKFIEDGMVGGAGEFTGGTSVKVPMSDSLNELREMSRE